MNVIARVDLKENEIRLVSVPGGRTVHTEKVKKSLKKLWHADILPLCRKASKKVKANFLGYRIIEEDNRE